jgi:hypothetical protein
MLSPVEAVITRSCSKWGWLVRTLSPVESCYRPFDKNTDEGIYTVM